jgi:hypothetical protein
MHASRLVPVRRSAYVAQTRDEERSIPVEAPVAIEINGVTYAVMMATPTCLEDFVTGFLLSEGLAGAHEIGPISLHPLDDENGYVARITLPAHCVEPIMARARHRMGDSSCGICGIESVEAALRPLPPLPLSVPVRPEAILKGLRDAARGTAARTGDCGHARGSFLRPGRAPYRRARRCWPAQCAGQGDRFACALGHQRGRRFPACYIKSIFRARGKGRARLLSASGSHFGTDRPCRQTRSGSGPGACCDRTGRFNVVGLRPSNGDSQWAMNLRMTSARRKASKTRS